jgi:putative Ig domain-containing protein
MRLRIIGVSVLAAFAGALALAGAGLALDIADGDPPSGTVGTPYSYTFQLSPGSGSPGVTWNISSGALPPGLSLHGNDRTATVSGTPTQAGSYHFYLQAVDAPGPWVCCTEVQYTINIGEGLSIVTGTLPAGSVGTAYGFQLGTSGGTANSWTVTAGSLPAGLTLGNNGAITGTPTAASLSTFTVRASDGSRVATKQFTLGIAEPIVVTAPDEETVKAGRSFVVTFSATGGVQPYQWSATGLPAGINLDPATGKVGGRPTEEGDIQLSVTAKDALGTTQTSTAVVHVVGKISITTTDLPAARNGKRYRAVLEAEGGGEPLTLKLLGGLPRGLTFDAAQGVLQGVPKLAARKPLVRTKVKHTAAGTKRVRVVIPRKPLAHRYTLYFIVRDSLGQRASQKLRLTVGP